MTSALPALDPSLLEKGIVVCRFADVENSMKPIFPDVLADSAVLSIPSDLTLEESVTLDIPSGLTLSVFLGARSRSFIHLVASGDATVFVHASAEANAQVLLEARQPGSIVQRSTLDDNAELHWHNVTLASGTIDQSLVSRVKGINASSSVSWLFYAKNTDAYTLNCRNIFDGHNGGGEITMKGVAENTAHASAKGLIEIGLKGNGTDTYLTQNVLMLDSSSKVDAVPGLEIKTNDVKASHSATVSRVTEEDLFYFASRGIEAREARGMYVQGFLADLTSEMRDSKASEAILTAIERKYAQK